MTATETAKTCNSETATFLAVVGQNMPQISGDAMRGWIENPKSLERALRTALCPPETTATVPHAFATWKTITIGAQKSVKDLSKALTSNGFRISDWAAEILKKTTLAHAETEIELALVSGADLGFTKATSRDAIYDRAKELGLDLVPAEVGPQLCLQYRDQPLGEWLLVAMEPIGGLDAFRVAHRGDGRWLDSDYGFPGSEWYPANRWVFARRKAELH